MEAEFKGGFRDLEAYKQAVIFRKQVRNDCKKFPKEETYLLKAQLLDASRSITANMAEGYGRFNYQETSQFFRISRGSLNECLDHLSSALDEGYLTLETYIEREKQYELVLKLTNGYIAYLQRKKSM